MKNPIPILLLCIAFGLSSCAIQVGTPLQQANEMANKACSQAKNGKLAEAKATAQKALQLDRRSAQAHYIYAWLLDNENNFQAAIDESKIAISLKRNPGYYAELAHAYFNAGNFNEAVNTWKQLLELDPSSPDANHIHDLIAGAEHALKFQSLASAQAPDYFSAAMMSERWKLKNGAIAVICVGGQRNEGLRQESIKALREACGEWETALRGKVRFVFKDEQDELTNEKCLKLKSTPGEPATQNRKEFLHKRTEKPTITCKLIGDPSQYTLATTNDETDVHASHGVIFRADIILLTKSRYSGKPFSFDQMRLHCVHEIGHALGINGHSTNPDDVMFALYDYDRMCHLASRDITTIRHLF